MGIYVNNRCAVSSTRSWCRLAHPRSGLERPRHQQPALWRCSNSQLLSARVSVQTSTEHGVTLRDGERFLDRKPASQNGFRLTTKDSEWPVRLPDVTWKESLAAFTQSTGANPIEVREQLLGGATAEFYAISPPAHDTIV